MSIVPASAAIIPREAAQSKYAAQKYKKTTYKRSIVTINQSEKNGTR